MNQDNSRDPQPLTDLSEEEQRAWDAVLPQVRATGQLRPIDAAALTLLVRAFFWYTELLREIERFRPTADVSELEVAAETERLHVREMAAKFLLLDEARVRVAPLDADGNDMEIAAWFAPPASPNPTNRKDC